MNSNVLTALMEETLISQMVPFNIHNVEKLCKNIINWQKMLKVMEIQYYHKLLHIHHYLRRYNELNTRRENSMKPITENKSLTEEENQENKKKYKVKIYLSSII